MLLISFVDVTAMGGFKENKKIKNPSTFPGNLACVASVTVTSLRLTHHITSLGTIESIQEKSRTHRDRSWTGLLCVLQTFGSDQQYHMHFSFYRSN